MRRSAARASSFHFFQTRVWIGTFYELRPILTIDFFKNSNLKSSCVRTKSAVKSLDSGDPFMFREEKPDKIVTLRGINEADDLPDESLEAKVSKSDAQPRISTTCVRVESVNFWRPDVTTPDPSI
jgi:hypothetical protein